MENVLLAVFLALLGPIVGPIVTVEYKRLRERPRSQPSTTTAHRVRPRADPAARVRPRPERVPRPPSRVVGRPRRGDISTGRGTTEYGKDYSSIGGVAGAVAGGLAGLVYAWLTKDADGAENFLFIGLFMGSFVGWAYGKLSRRRLGG